MTLGATGRDLVPVCDAHKSTADFLYVENAHHGFGLVTVTKDSFTVEYKGVANNQTTDLFTATIIRPSNKDEII
jgi:hypothetical protein